MYSQERSQWWIARSQSPAYQQAYDRIVGRMRLSNQSVIIDSGCGTGEILKRLYKKMGLGDRDQSSEQPLLIGTEVTSEMLECAMNNLQSAGIEARIVENADTITQHRGVVLVNDDISDSQLPPDIADFTLLTFPELIMKVTPAARQIMDRFKKLPAIGIKSLVRDYCLARITKKGGKILFVDYSASQGEHSKYDRISMLARTGLAKLSGLQLVETSFFESPEIWDDTDEDFREVKPGSRVGYRIFIYGKGPGSSHKKKFKMKDKKSR